LFDDDDDDGEADYEAKDDEFANNKEQKNRDDSVEVINWR
jgi:hypothetical protein